MRKRITGIIVSLVFITAAIPLATASAQTPGLLDHVVISPGSATVLVGGNQQFVAVAQDSDNATVDNVTYSWVVVAGGGTIDDAGLFTAGNTTGNFTNTVQVTATKGDITKSANATVTVTASGLLDHVVISPSSATVLVGGNQQFVAVAQDSDNATVDNVTYGWAVVAGGGTIDEAGLFTSGNTTGNFTNTVQVTATKGDITKTAYATVTVTSSGLLDHVVISPSSASVLVGGNQQFVAVAQDSDNATVDNVTYNWAVVAGGGTIDEAGLFTAGNTTDTFTNTVQVTAVKGDITKTAYATVTVTAKIEKEFRVPPGWSHGNKMGWQGGETPPGWSKGEKTGWGGKEAPPGLMKKQEK